MATADLREVARRARDYVVSKNMEPRAAWDEAAGKLLGSAALARKGSTRNTFLGLCEAGRVKGIPPGAYLDKSDANKEHAVRMVDLLIDDPFLLEEPRWLFVDATDGKVNEDGQTDVVIGLWNAGMIETENGA